MWAFSFVKIIQKIQKTTKIEENKKFCMWLFLFLKLPQNSKDIATLKIEACSVTVTSQQHKFHSAKIIVVNLGVKQDNRRDSEVLQFNRRGEG